MKIRLTRDFIILPLLALATFAGCIAVAETFARLVMPEELRDSCGAEGGYKANCVSRMKVAEGPEVEMRYNDCASRSDAPCLAPPAGNFRIVTLGTSVSNGYGVALEDMYSTVAARQLTASCKRPVDFQHVTMAWEGSSAADVAQGTAEHTAKALDIKPNLLLVVVTSWDLYKYVEAANQPIDPALVSAASASGGFRDTVIFKFGQRVMSYLRDQREASRFVLMVRGLLYRNEDRFLPGYLGNVEESGYMSVPLQPSWEQRIAMFEMTLTAVQARASAAGVPVAVVYSPADAQVLLARRKDRDGFDPEQLGRRFAEIAARHGWLQVDPLARFVAASPREALYYRVNGHPTGVGHRLIGASIADAVASTPTLGCRAS